MRFLTAGESHGRAMLAIIEGFPANVPIDKDKIAAVLSRRRQAPGRSSRQKLETDGFRILSGMLDGLTLGTPLAVSVPNAEAVKWSEVMDPWASKGMETVAVPRPGHADLAGAIKYRLDDLRLVAERASARETVVRTLAGSFALQLLQSLEVRVTGRTVACGDIDDAARTGDTVGGIIQVEVDGLPGGIGSHVHYDRRLDARLAGAVMGIQAVKGIEFGPAFAMARLPGSLYHDEYKLQNGTISRGSNNAGGVEGGMSNGQPIILRAAVKPIPTLERPLASYNLRTGQICPAPVSRHDISGVGAAAVIAETVCAWEIADCLLAQFGGDNLEDLRDRFFAYRRRWEEALTCPGQ